MSSLRSPAPIVLSLEYHSPEASRPLMVVVKVMQL